MQKRSWEKPFAVVAVVLPIAMIALGVMQAQWNRSQGQRWNFPMQAYDPRDLLRGKYLNVRFKYEVAPKACTSGECCVCYKDVEFEPSVPVVHPVSCEQAAQDCQAWLRLGALGSSYRYFVPEDKSVELEDRVIQAVQEERARAEFVLDQSRRPQITGLILDGTPI